MRADNFNNKAERGVAEYYAGTMQPLGVHSSILDYSYSTSVPVVPKHRRAAYYSDYLAYCNKASATGMNLHLTNGVKSSVVNIKLNGSLTTHEFSGDWHLVSTDTGIRYFLPVYNTSGSTRITEVQYGEIEISSSGAITEIYSLYRSMTSVAQSFPYKCAFVDAGEDVYMVSHHSSFSVGVYNVYFGGVEFESVQPTMEFVSLMGTGGSVFVNTVWGISSFDTSKNFVFVNGSAGSYGFSIDGATDDYSTIFIKPAAKALLDFDEDDFLIDAYEVFSLSATTYNLSLDYRINRSPVTDGDETPLWHTRNEGLAFSDTADEYVSLLKGSLSNWTTASPLSYYAWFATEETRAYYPYFDSSDAYYKTLSMIDGTAVTYKGIRQKDFESGYAPVMIPIEGDSTHFITYYGIENGAQYFYRTMAIPNLIENDKGLFYPTFVGEEEGSIVLDGENSALRYERIGNIVHIFGVVSPTSSTAVGALKLTNLPYPISNEFFDTDFTLDQAGIKLTPIKLAGSNYYTLYFCNSQPDHTLTSAATAMTLGRWAFNFRYMTN